MNNSKFSFIFSTHQINSFYFLLDISSFNVDSRLLQVREPVKTTDFNYINRSLRFDMVFTLQGILFMGSSTRTLGEKSRSAVSSSRVLALRSRVYNRPHTTCYSVHIYICSSVYTGCTYHKFYNELASDLGENFVTWHFFLISRVKYELIFKIFINFTKWKTELFSFSFSIILNIRVQ